jgi:hypothetical protein
MTQRVIVQIDDWHVEVKGRDLWALKQLFAAGSRGCTAIDNPAPRWSGYVHNLRRAGFEIETIHESHKGAFPGTHARYILHTTVEIMLILDPEPVA